MAQSISQGKKIVPASVAGSLAFNTLTTGNANGSRKSVTNAIADSTEDAVVFNYKKHDYETAFLEKGIRKNIGVFSPSVDDTAYICKLLASNFNKSPRSKEYKHYLLARNDLFTKKYDIAGDIKPQNRTYTSLDVLDRIVDTFEKRRREAELINNYHQYSSLKDFAFDAFCLRTQYVADYDKSDEAEVFNTWIEISQFFDGYAPSDIPLIKSKISEVYEFDKKI